MMWRVVPGKPQGLVGCGSFFLVEKMYLFLPSLALVPLFWLSSPSLYPGPRETSSSWWMPGGSDLDVAPPGPRQPAVGGAGLRGE
jgi:hypothetical protein